MECTHIPGHTDTVLSLMVTAGYYSHSASYSHDLAPDYFGDEAPPGFDEEVEDGPGVTLGKGGGCRNYQTEEDGGEKHQTQHPEAREA